MKIQRIPPNWKVRLRSGLPAGIKTFLASSGLGGTIVTFFAAAGTIFPFTWIAMIGGACILSGISATVIKGKVSHLPDEILFEENGDEHYKATFSTKEGLSEANSLTKPYYRHEFVPDWIAEGWREKNPKGFISITNSANELCACFGILALDESFMKQFIKGRLVDNELGPDDILDPAKSKTAIELYISGVVVRDPDTLLGHRRACVMVWTMLQYLQKYYGIRKKRILYALAVSKTSENMLKKSYFTIKTSDSNRKDKLNLYSTNLTKDFLEKMYRRIGDYSKICECNFG